MKMFIELTDDDRLGKISVNVDQIEMLWEIGGSTKISMSSGSTVFVVESREEILAIIRSLF